MTIRVSSSAIFDKGSTQLGRHQFDLTKLQNKIGSGKRITTPADDPSGAARVLDLKYTEQGIEQIVENQHTAQTRLDQSESVVAGSLDILQNIMDKLVRTRNGVNTQADMRSLATEIRGSMQELMGLANSRDSEGNFIFSGFAATTQPFTEVGSTIKYNGDNGAVQAQIGFQRKLQISDNGADLFVNIKNGNGYFKVASDASNTGGASVLNATVQNPTALTKHNYETTIGTDALGKLTYTVTDVDAGATVATGNYKSGEAIEFDGMQITLTGTPASGDKFTVAPSSNQSVFDTLMTLAKALESNAVTDAQKAQQRTAIFDSAESVNQAFEHLLDRRVSIGTRLGEVEAFGSIMGMSSDAVAKEIGRHEDLDYASAVSELTKKQTVFEAAQMSYMKIINSSLFDYMK